VETSFNCSEEWEHGGGFLLVVVTARAHTLARSREERV
jgi:hypothetical protein